MPAGLLVTVPAPVPGLVTVKAYELRVNIALTLLSAVIETVHVVPNAESQPVQLEKVYPVDDDAVKVTEVL